MQNHYNQALITRALEVCESLPIGQEPGNAARFVIIELCKRLRAADDPPGALVRKVQNGLSATITGVVGFLAGTLFAGVLAWAFLGNGNA